MSNDEQFALFDFDDVASPEKSSDAEKAAETSIAEVEADPVDAANHGPRRQMRDLTPSRIPALTSLHLRTCRRQGSRRTATQSS